MASTSRFSEDEENKIAEIIDSAVPANTKGQTNSSVLVFNGELSKKKVFFGIFFLLYISLYDLSLITTAL